MKRILFSPEMHDEQEEEQICPNGNRYCENVEDGGDYHGFCGDCKVDVHEQSIIDGERDV